LTKKHESPPFKLSKRGTGTSYLIDYEKAFITVVLNISYRLSKFHNSKALFKLSFLSGKTGVISQISILFMTLPETTGSNPAKPLRMSSIWRVGRACEGILTVVVIEVL
jgi:hypothetical protein